MSAPDVVPDHLRRPTGRSTGSRPAVAYLVSRYPTLSHAFIENEVEALRAAGVEVHTFSVRPAPADQQRSARSRREAATTTTVLDRARAGAWATASGRALRRPGALAAAAALAARSGPGTARSKVWQAFYLAEAVAVLDEMRRRDLRHLHVHFANNGADIARLVVAMGRAQDGPDAGWRWTLSMHGPTEFEQVDAFDLPAKVRSADAVACISDFCRSQLMRHVEPEHWGKLGLVRMAVDADRFADASAERAGRPAGPLRVLFVGRLVPEKGPALLLDAVARLRRAEPGLDLRVRVVGSGPLAGDLAQQVAREGLGDVVDLVGPLGNEELPAQYAWADVFCLPSFAEGVPVVLMEAMATALPVVTTRIAGVPELVRDGVDGRLVTAGRVDALVDALREVALAGPEERRERGAAGRRHVVEEFSPDLNTRRLREVVGV
ncbi:glycosyltransferase [Kineococcus sp. SYSU DK004]|uniref:glycosyltransferase n=1 Tax=Kineococcus sp. SYSU DK004 TaxID=3383125 RepID=UPI003D7DBFFB